MLDAAIPLPVAVLTAGAALLFGVAAVLVAASGREGRIARRLASARQVRVADVLRLSRADRRPVRISGRVRCGQPIVTADGERLVALHRTVEVELRGAGWRPLERIRESRIFQLWDHAGELDIDPAHCAEPIVAIPGRWRGPAGELPEEYQPSIRRLEEIHGGPARAARSETRTVSVIDRILLLAVPVVDAGGTVSLTPPRGGYILSTLELEAAMRLLVGRRAPLIAGALVTGGLGVLCALAAAVAGVAAVVTAL